MNSCSCPSWFLYVLSFAIVMYPIPIFSVLVFSFISSSLVVPWSNCSFVVIVICPIVWVFVFVFWSVFCISSIVNILGSYFIVRLMSDIGFVVSMFTSYVYVLFSYILSFLVYTFAFTYVSFIQSSSTSSSFWLFYCLHHMLVLFCILLVFVFVLYFRFCHMCIVLLLLLACYFLLLFLLFVFLFLFFLVCHMCIFLLCLFHRLFLFFLLLVVIGYCICIVCMLLMCLLFWLSCCFYCSRFLLYCILLHRHLWLHILLICILFLFFLLSRIRIWFVCRVLLGFLLLVVLFFYYITCIIIF